MLCHDGMQGRDLGGVWGGLVNFRVESAIEGGPPALCGLAGPLDGQPMILGRNRSDCSPRGPRYSLRITTSVMAVSSKA